MSIFDKINNWFKEGLEAPKVATPLTTYEIDLVPNAKYRLTRQMFLFPSQEVGADTNDFVKIGETVTYLKSGEIVEDNRLLSPWVYVRHENGKKTAEGWCFSHCLQKVEA
jgi:hypothetical protein